VTYNFGLCVLALGLLSSNAAEPPGKPGPWQGQLGICQTVSEIMLREKLGSTRVRNVRPEFEMKSVISSLKVQRSADEEKLKTASLSTGNAPVVTGTSYIAGRYADSGSVPPDSTGDIGPIQFLLCINGRIRTFDRAGNSDGVLNATTANFFDSVRGTGDTADPRVRYDRMSRRWFISMLSYDTPTRVVLAVSSGSSITPGTSFTFFYFAFSQVGRTPNSDTGSFYDFDTLGLDRHALYIGGSVFDPSGPSYVGSTGFVINKANLLAGNLTVTAFRQMASNSIVGPFSPQGVDNDDPNANEGYFIGRDNSSNDRLLIRRIFDPGGTPTISANIAVTVSPLTEAKGGVLALGSSYPVQDLDARLFQARMRSGHLITGHNIAVNSTGAADSAGDRDAVRWYDIITLATNPTLAQSGTLFDSASTNPRSYWMPSAARSGQGHLAIGCNVAATNEYPEIAAAFHLAMDATGMTGGPSVIQSATANSNDLVNQFNQHRWGDYSTMCVDPNDDMTFWTVQEYSTAANSWAVRVIQIKAPPPATPNGASPTSLAQGQFDTDVVITGASSSGSGFFDPAAEFPNHIGVTVNGGGVTINRVVVNDPTHLTINITVSSTATLGSRTITVTNPDSQSASSSAGILTIDPSTDSDGDGIPDWWMELYFGHAIGQANDRSRASDDADGDGLTNIQEFHAHTNPRNSASTLRITLVQKAADGMHITFTSVSGKSYRLESKNSLGATNWSLVTDNIAGLNGTTTVGDPGAIGVVHRFYSIVVIN
jgi:hypothetical protein